MSEETPPQEKKLTKALPKRVKIYGGLGIALVIILIVGWAFLTAHAQEKWREHILSCAEKKVKSLSVWERESEGLSYKFVSSEEKEDGFHFTYSFYDPETNVEVSTWEIIYKNDGKPAFFNTKAVELSFGFPQEEPAVDKRIVTEKAKGYMTRSRCERAAQDWIQERIKDPFQKGILRIAVELDEYIAPYWYGKVTFDLRRIYGPETETYRIRAGGKGHFVVEQHISGDTYKVVE